MCEITKNCAKNYISQQNNKQENLQYESDWNSSQTFIFASHLHSVNKINFALKKIHQLYANNFVHSFLLALLFLTVGRVIWLSNNFPLLGSKSFSPLFHSFLLGIRCDLPVVAVFYAPLWSWILFSNGGSVRYKKITQFLFLLITFCCLLLNIIDTFYSPITGKRTGSELFTLLSDPGNKISTFVYDYWWMLVVVLGLTSLSVLLMPKNPTTISVFSLNKKGWIKLLWLLPIVAVWILANRAGVALKPLRSLHIADYAPTGNAALANSTPLQILSTWQNEKLPNPMHVSLPELEKILQPQRNYHNSSYPENKKNICLIIVESLSRDYTGFSNKKPYTPFLDSLSKECMRFEFCFANGTKSMDMLPAIFSGIPVLQEQNFINTGYAQNSIGTYLQLFADKGYDISFYHGANNGTMGFKAYFATQGFQNYFGLNELNSEFVKNNFDGTWGIFDEPYLQYWITELNQKKKPFFSSIFTLSSHHPYSIPAKYNSQFKEGPLKIHKSIQYTDFSLKKFFETAKQQSWYNNTVFVITGDHTSYSTEDYFYSPAGHFEIPFLIYNPKQTHDTTIAKITSQCGIIPTLLHYLNFNSSFYSVNPSALDQSEVGGSFHYSEGKYYYIQFPYVIAMNKSAEITDFLYQERGWKKRKNLPFTGSLFLEMKAAILARYHLYCKRLNDNSFSIQINK